MTVFRTLLRTFSNTGLTPFVWPDEAIALGDAATLLSINRIVLPGDMVSRMKRCSRSEIRNFPMIIPASRFRLLSLLGATFLLVSVPNARCGDPKGLGNDDGIQQPIDDLKATAESGDANAQLELGMVMSKKGESPKARAEALAWIRKAAEQGLPEAQSRLGEFYFMGASVEANPERAVDWWRKAATQGYAEAQYHLGYAYQAGRGVLRDPVEALAWYRKAAEQGFRHAQDSIGMMYEAGEGEPEELSEARRKAAENGLASAQFDLGYSYLSGRNVEQDGTEAIKWLTKAAEQDHTWAMYYLSMALVQQSKASVRQNQPGSSDLANAAKWLLKAAESGHPEARGVINVFLGQVGKSYKQKNESPPAWFGESLKRLRETGEEGQAWAQFNLGMIYANGHAVPADHVEAYKWFSLAASQPEGEQWSERSAAFRRQLGKKLTREEVAKAKRRAAAISDQAKSPAK